MTGTPLPQRGAGTLEVSAVAVAAAAHFLVSNALPFGHYQDDIKWALLAESLARGSLRAQWSYFPLFETSLTWGYSVLLAPWIFLFGRHALLLKLVSTAYLAGGLGMFYAGVRPALSRGARVFLLAGLAGTSYALSFSGSVLSEAGYLLLWGALTAVFTAPRRPAGATPFRMGLLAGALISIRTVGIAVPLAAAAAPPAGWQRRETALFLGGTSLTALPVFLISKALSGEWSFYAKYWVLPGGDGRLWARALNNLYFYFKGFSCMTVFDWSAVAPPSVILKAASLTIVLSFVLLGGWTLRRSSAGKFLALYAALYMGILAFWSYQAPRYFLPIYPVLVFFLARGMDTATTGRGRGLVSAGALAILLWTNRSESAVLVRRSFQRPVEIAHRSEEWVRDHTEPTEPVVSTSGSTLFYFGGRRAVPFLPGRDAASFAAEARRIGARFVFLEAGGFVQGARGVDDPIAAHHRRVSEFLKDPSLFRVVYANPEEEKTVYALTDPPTLPPKNPG